MHNTQATARGSCQGCAKVSGDMQQLQRGSDDASTGSSEALGTANQQERGRCGARAGLEAVQLRARAETAYWTDWTSVDQAALEQSLRRYPAGQYPPLERYVRIAACLEGKDVRDVAFRNYAILCAFYANLGQHKADEDNDLLRRFRDNILVILNQINSASAEAMRHQS
ncbi:hypothetical protein WJX72_004912 [[Myrmecia] bisecta]|uniref:Uncharacterized protein n=1 Tax=[Myrmecia] bisecta TaxID=41462 RepID=A0AAW1QQH5_9CHLO